MVVIKLFTKPFCQDCLKMHTKLEELSSIYSFTTQEFDLETADGMAEGLFYGVDKVPHIIVDEKTVKYEGDNTFEKIENLVKG
jgi:hypothetical protein